MHSRAFRIYRGLAGTVLAAVILVLPSPSLASFSGQNGRVFYEQEGDIWSVNPDGSGAVDLTLGNTGSEQRPSPSSDGRHVVYQAFSGEGWYVGHGWNIFSMNADGSNQVQLTKTEEPVINFEPSFSPDGSKIVFMRRGFPSGEQDIWVIDANGTGAVNLTHSPGVNEFDPEFSPDGTSIVYIRPIRRTAEAQRYGRVQQRHLGHERQRLEPQTVDRNEPHDL